MHVDRYHFASLLPIFGVPEAREHGARVGKSQDSLNREQHRSGEHQAKRQDLLETDERGEAGRADRAQSPRSDRILDITV